MSESNKSVAPLAAYQITKRFPGVLALDDVSLEIEAGKVHAIVGENGAGKSTLMQVFGGVYSPDAGHVTRNGQAIRLTSPQDAKNHGIQIVYQELSLSPKLTVAENIFANRPPTSWFGLIRFKEMAHHVEDMFARFGFAQSGIRPNDIVAELPIGKQQLVEIMTAISASPDVLILDEPTSSLSSVDIEQLYDAIKEFKTEGIAIIYISHHLHEVFEIADLVTVMKDGRIVETADANDVDEQWIVKRMVGREIGDLYSSGDRHPPHDEKVLDVENLSDTGAFWDVSLSVRRGEILGVAGLVGAGRTELARAIAGFEKTTRGSIRLEETTLKANDPVAAMRAGIIYATEDRRVDGMFSNMTLWENLAAHEIALGNPLGWLAIDRIQEDTRQTIKTYNIATPSENQILGRLSGGNQQKVLLAGWLSLHPKVLIVDEPTRGVDVGAKAEIYRLLRSLARSGVGIIMISSDLLEILGLSDRVLVMRHGHVAGHLNRNEMTEERIIGLAAGASGATEVN